MDYHEAKLLNALQREPLTNQEKAANCRKLADILDNVEGSAFDMKYWVRKSECGTVACALGHAVLSGMIPGVEVVTRGSRHFSRVEGSGDFVPWDTVGEVFFGRDACEYIFRDTSPRGVHRVAGELRDEAVRLLKENDDE